MTQVISSFAFAHSTWFILSPVYKRNVMARGERYASSFPVAPVIHRLSFNGVITKNQLAKLCSVINSVLIVVVFIKMSWIETENHSKVRDQHDHRSI